MLKHTAKYVIIHLTDESLEQARIHSRLMQHKSGDAWEYKLHAMVAKVVS
jgi:hypothetical protein